MQQQRFTVEEGELVGLRLDAALAQVWATTSRQTWQQRIRDGLVQVGDAVVLQPARKLQVDDEVGYMPLVNEAHVQPSVYTGPAIPVIYEDNDVLVVNKPAGVVVHAGDGTPSNQTVASCFADRIEQDGSDRAGIVHRLDKDTSGVMILARSLSATQMLKAQFKARTVDKYYQALVWGHLDQSEARIELPLARHRSTPTKMSVRSDGKEAVSEYRVLTTYDDYSLLEVKLLTGRMHQIRVHLAYLGHPIVGDAVYGRTNPSELSHQFLHAARLSVTLPNGQRKEFEADLPFELKQFLQHLT